MFTRIAAILLWLVSVSSEAGINHGLNTTFDPNSWGGAANVSCLTAAIPGTCATGYNATCNGVADDTAALTAFQTARIALNPALAVLYVPPGSKCVIPATSFVYTTNDAAIANTVVWAYGATFITSGGMRVGGSSFSEDSTHEAFIVSANAGDTSVTLITAGDAAIFSIGDWIAVTGLELEACCGFPPNFQRFEFHQITSITGTTTKVVSFTDSKLKNTYLSTWPSIQSDGSMGNNGPAKIFKMVSAWNINLTIYGMTVTATTYAGSQDSIVGRIVNVYNSTFLTKNTSPSVGGTITINGSSVNGMEVDKVLDTLIMNYDTVRSNLTFQSPVPVNFYGNNLTILGSTSTPWNSTFNNVKISNQMSAGPSGFYGVGNSISISNSIIPTSKLNNNSVLAADMTFTSGTLSVAHASSAAFRAALRWGIPGHKYAFADSDGSLDASPSATFSISAVRDDGATIFFDMSGCSWGSCSGALPMTSCGSNTPCPEYVAYPAATITQTNSGPADLTQFAAPP